MGTSNQLLLFMFTGLEKLLVKTSGKYCVGDEVSPICVELPQHTTY